MDIDTSKRKILLGLLVASVLGTLALWYDWFALDHSTPITTATISRSNHRFYSTTFTNAEDPVSENGSWVVSHGDFASVQTIPGLAFGSQAGNKTGLSKYDDSTAVLTGNWGPDQFVQIVVHHSGAPTDSDYDEVEIRLRSTISEKSNTGYEINCRVGRAGKLGYIQVGKVNGPLGNFTGPFDEKMGRNYLCHDGDVMVATIEGAKIKAYINGEQVLEANDATYSSGAPGIGFYKEGNQAKSIDFGISSVIASDHVPAEWKPSSPLRAHIQHRVRFVRAWFGRLRDSWKKRFG